MTILLSVLCLPLGVWTGILLVQAIAACLPVPAVLLVSQRPRIAILIPAHNESAGIIPTLQSIKPQLLPGDRLLVVADNCDDETASIAAAAGAEVVERHDIARRGKGYALDRGIRHMSNNPPEIVIVIDADCKVEPGAVDCLARACKASGRPTQALYLMRSPEASEFAKLREFAWVVRNLVRPLGNRRLGQPCQLMGTGMAFPWELISAAPLANGNLVEDMQLGIDLARAGAAPQFCPQARVYSEFPTGKEGIRQQRHRWEHGHLGMIFGVVPKLLIDAVRHRDMHLLALALDMSVPPLALLVLSLVVLGMLSLLFQLSSPLLAVLYLLLTLAAAIFLSWWHHGRGVLGLSTLLFAPVYALEKLPLYTGFLKRRQVEWVRSSRD